MRILYIGGLNSGSTGIHRFNMMRNLGYSVIPLDISKFNFYIKYRILRKIQSFLKIKIYNLLINNYIKIVSSNYEYDLIFISKGIWINKNTIFYLTRKKAKIVHYTPDPAFKFHRTKEFVNCVPFYDLCITTKEWELEDYYKNNCKNVLLVDQGINIQFFKPMGLEKSIDVVFVGHFEKHYYSLIKFLDENGISVQIYGDQWFKNIDMMEFKLSVVNKGVWGVDYVNVLSRSKIGLGLLSKYVPETTTTRSFEIPSCGTLLLAERTSRHEELFVDKQEAVFFDSNDKFDLLNKVKYYLDNDIERNEICKRGREKILNSEVDNKSIMQKIFKTINSL